MKRIEAFKESYRHSLVVREIAKDLFGHFSEYYVQAVFHDFAKRIRILLSGDKTASYYHVLRSRHHEHFVEIAKGVPMIVCGEPLWDGVPIKHLVEAAIDWQSARFTKPDKPLDAYGTWKKWYFGKHQRQGKPASVEVPYVNTLKILQILSEKKNLKWGMFWDWEDGYKLGF